MTTPECPNPFELTIARPDVIIPGLGAAATLRTGRAGIPLAVGRTNAPLRICASTPGQTTAANTTSEMANPRRTTENARANRTLKQCARRNNSVSLLLRSVYIRVTTVVQILL